MMLLTIFIFIISSSTPEFIYDVLDEVLFFY